MTQTPVQPSGDWMEREELAEAMIPLLGRLYRRNAVSVSLYGWPLSKASVVEILQGHRYTRHRHANVSELPIQQTLPLLQALPQLNLGPANIDLGRLTVKYQEQAAGTAPEDFLRAELAPLVDKAGSSELKDTDVVLYGFGRIGRLVARILIKQADLGAGPKLRAIVVRKGASNDLVKRASLLRRDSVHGHFEGNVVVDEVNNDLIINGNRVHVIYSNDPASVNYTQYGIKDAIVVDNTGKWRDKEGLSQHLQSKGVAKVILTAPGKGSLKNIVMGVNHKDVSHDDTILTAASCTTNAIAPVLKAINARFGIDNGHLETVHSYTNDQNLIDNFHKGSRRGRSAALNMVITETGAAKAVGKALPELAGKLTGNAIRVPTPDVSLAVLNLNLSQATNKEEVNEYLREVALYSDLRQQIDFFTSPEVVSSDFVGSQYASIVDAEATLVTDNRLVLYVWYDNEFGYSCQVVRLIEHALGADRPELPNN